jgi:hypothetical protein
MFIELTHYSGDKVFVNTEHISLMGVVTTNDCLLSVVNQKSITQLTLQVGGGCCEVKETPQQIMKLISQEEPPPISQDPWQGTFNTSVTSPCPSCGKEVTTPL